MADQDLEIKVTSTADLSGIKEAETAVSNLGKSAVTSKFPLAPIPEELKEGAGAFGEGTAGTTGLVGAAANAERLATASLLVGGNLTRASREAVILARELATGVPTTRTLSSLIGSLPPPLIAAAGIAVGIPVILGKIIEHQQSINSELDVQLTKLTESAQKWAEIAKGATSTEGIEKVAEASAASIENLEEQIRTFQNQGVSWWKQAIDSILSGPGFEFAPFEKEFKDHANRQGHLLVLLKSQAVAAARLATEYKNAFDAEKAKPLSDAISDITGKLKNAEEAAKTNLAPDAFLKNTAQIGRLKKELTELINLQSQLRREAEASAKALELTKSTNQVIGDQRRAAFEHEADRAALEQKRREAVAVGDTERARAIADQLKDDTFGRDQQRDYLQRYVANQESLLHGDFSQQNELKTFGKRGLQQYEDAQKKLNEIYAQEKMSPGKDNGSDILATLRLILAEFR